MHQLNPSVGTEPVCITLNVLRHADSEHPTKHTTTNITIPITSTSLPQTSLTYSPCSVSFTMHLTIRNGDFLFVFMHLFFFIFPLLRGRANIFYLFPVVSLCVKNSVVHGAPPKCGMNEFDGHIMSFFKNNMRYTSFPE